MSQPDRDPREHQLPVEFAVLLDAIRSEFDSKLTSLKLWGVLGLFGGGTLGGLVSRVVAPEQTAGALHAVTHLLPL